MTVKILSLLDTYKSVSDEQKLSLEYGWSRAEVFSQTPRVNFVKCGNLYLNTNHTATHALMNIKLLLNTYEVDYSECELLISKHPSVENSEVREFYRNRCIKGFKYSLKLKGIENEKIDIIVKNFIFLNRVLDNVSPGFNDFFLFEDYTYFIGYKNKTIEYTKKQYGDTKKERAIEKTLEYLDDYYRNDHIYEILIEKPISDDFRDSIKKEIETLFALLKTNVISASKLFARMGMIYENEMNSLGELNNETDFYALVRVLFRKEYYYKKPFIMREKEAIIDSESLLYNYACGLEQFRVGDLTDYADKMHIKGLNNYAEFLERFSDNYVRADVDLMVKKELVDVSDDAKVKIDKELSYFINSYGPINTKNFFAYDDFPEIGYEWNKYLLIGVVMTFLPSKYKVERTKGTYKACEFIITFVEAAKERIL